MRVGLDCSLSTRSTNENLTSGRTKMTCGHERLRSVGVILASDFSVLLLIVFYMLYHIKVHVVYVCYNKPSFAKSSDEPKIILCCSSRSILSMRF